MPILNILNQANQEHKVNLAPKGRLVGIDLGTKRIGLAVTDETRTLCTPKLILNRQNLESDLKKIKEFCEEYQIIAIILGLPIKLDESSNDMTALSLEFSEKLNEYFSNKLPIFLFEERLTSFEARDIVKNLRQNGVKNRKNKHIDDIAASLILEHFLKLD